MVAFADALKAKSGAPLVRAAHVSSQLPLPRELPDVVAATPAALMAATEEYGRYAGWQWTKEGIVARCRAAAMLASETDLPSVFCNQLVATPQAARPHSTMLCFLVRDMLCSSTCSRLGRV